MRRVLLVALCVAAVAAFVRVGYRPLGWGGYVYVELTTPW